MLSVLALALLAVAHADVYMHNPRGSNNRLNEQNSNRATGNRMFDSQNNARGGYNVGDKAYQAFDQPSNPDGMSTTPPDPTRGFTAETTPTRTQYQMVYLEQSELSIEWTAQHGCGGAPGEHQLNCAVVLQYSCDTSSAVTDRALQVYLRDGGSTGQSTAPTTTNTQGLAEINAAEQTNAGLTAGNNPNVIRGKHENEAYYYECAVRSRNKGLFLADQSLQGREFAVFTRQNRDDTARRGLECPEERDYYPYWGPTIWKDIAYLSNDVNFCERNIAPKSQNVVSKYKCVDGTGQYTKATLRPIDSAECLAQAGAQWVGSTHGLPAPVCRMAPWSQANHLGNAKDNYGQPAMFNWTLPSWDTLMASNVRAYSSPAGELARCVVRMRYNISTDDYEPWNTTYRSNQGGVGAGSPVLDDPLVDIGVNFHDYNANTPDKLDPNRGLRLAIDTTQFGRTFQDRSHVFYIRRLSPAVRALLAGTTLQTLIDANLTAQQQYNDQMIAQNASFTPLPIVQPPDAALVQGLTPVGRVINLNVKGKRGNIVQTYPSTEYNFIPERVHVRGGSSDLLHIQWTGSNTHNNNGDGDGQGGDAGEGTGGTDRHNFVPLQQADDNYPQPYDRGVSIFNYTDCYTFDGVPVPTFDCQVVLATSGHFQSVLDAQTRYLTDAFNPTLNSSPPSLHRGIIIKFKPTAAGRTFHYMCTRNNSFSNRSQKGVIIVNAGDNA